MTNFRDPILIEIEAFIARSGFNATKVGRLSTNDPSLVSELRKGRELRHRTRERIRSFMQDADALTTKGNP